MLDAQVVYLTSQVLLLTLLLSLPAIVVAAVVGTLVSLLQALTQIQDQTLGFAVKLVAVSAALFMTARWLGGELYSFTVRVFDGIPVFVQ